MKKILNFLYKYFFSNPSCFDCEHASSPFLFFYKFWRFAFVFVSILLGSILVVSLFRVLTEPQESVEAINKRAIEMYSFCLHQDSLDLCIIANEFSKTLSNGKNIKYYTDDRTELLYNKLSNYQRLIDTTIYFQLYFKNLKEIQYCDSMVTFLYCYNNCEKFHLLYTTKNTKELQMYFLDYQIYINKLPKESSYWMYRIADNWYLYSTCELQENFNENIVSIDDIIKTYSGYVITDSLFLRQIAETMFEVNTYKGEVVTYLTNIKNYDLVCQYPKLHKLIDSVFNISNRLKRINEIEFCNNFVTFSYLKDEYKDFNLLYNPKYYSELPKNFFHYKLYKDTIPADSSLWIYQLNDFWYVLKK